MASVNFTSGTVIPNAWAVDVNSLVWGVFNGATTAALARTALGLGTAALSAATSFASSGLLTASGLTQTTGKLLGRTTASTGAIEEITVSTGLSLSAGVLSSTATGVVLGTPVVSTSGATIDFTSIPVGTKRITVNFKGVSTSGTDNPLFQLGDAGGIETSGYLCSSSAILTATCASVNFTTGFGLPSGSAANVIHGTIILTLENTTNATWVASGVFGLSNTTTTYTVAGSKSVSAAPVDRLRITTSGGTDTFDAGEINVTYEA